MSNEITTMEEIMEENTDKMIAAFTQEGGIDYLLQDVDEAVDSFEHDMSTKASRARTATLKQKVVRVKGKVDDVRKALTSERRAEIKKIDGFGKVARDHLIETAIRARKPLTDWEYAEQQRIDELEKQINAIAVLGETTNRETGEPFDLSILKANLEALDAVEVTEEIFGDKELDAFKARKFGSDLVANAIAREEGRIAQEEELNRLRAAEAKRAAEEMEKNRLAKAKEDERVAKEKQAAHDKQIAKEAREEAENAAEQAILDAAAAAKEAKEAENRLAESVKRAAADKIQADKDHKAEIKKAKEEAAAESLRQQQAARERLQREEAEREANDKHVTEVVDAAIVAIHKSTGMAYDVAKKVVTAIREGKIPNVKITF